MFILTFETTGPVGSVALTDIETGETREKRTTEPKAHLRMLAALTEKLLQEAGARPEDVAAAASSVGPGSYTGIRIGVTTARAFAQVREIPCISVPTLGMFRLRAEKEPAGVILNARRGQVYGALFAAGGGEILTPGPYLLKEVTEKARRSGLDFLFFGDGIDAYRESGMFGKELEGFRFADPSVRYQTADLAARYAREAFLAGRTCGAADLLPVYMRRTEAEIKLEDGSLARARERKMKKFRGEGGGRCSEDW